MVVAGFSLGFRGSLILPFLFFLSSPEPADNPDMVNTNPSNPKNKEKNDKFPLYFQTSITLIKYIKNTKNKTLSPQYSL